MISDEAFDPIMEQLIRAWHDTEAIRDMPELFTEEKLTVCYGPYQGPSLSDRAIHGLNLGRRSGAQRVKIPFPLLVPTRILRTLISNQSRGWFDGKCQASSVSARE